MALIDEILMSESIIYHIDTNFLLNYLIPDKKEFHEPVRKKLERNNWSGDVYKISKYALGESLNRVLNFEYTNSITLDSVFKKMEFIRSLLNNNKIKVFGLDDVDENWIQHFEKLMEIKDYAIQKADRHILALFCADSDAKRIYTVDYNIIRSDYINEYLEGLGKRVMEI